MLQLHLTRQHPVLCHSPHATTLRVQTGRAWITVERLHGADAVLGAGDSLRLPAGARALASGLPQAVLAVLEPAQTLQHRTAALPVSTASTVTLEAP